jgi:asparagine synthase (glutamine-hydrolysing)
MCGIAGIFHLDGRSADPLALGRMTRILAHRGPDGEGLYTDAAIGLGQRRLSIVDLSELGKQPMTNEDSSIWLTYNGEIYNHQPLRADLLAKGHHFRSQTDTEAIIHGYEEYGPGVIEWLNGMFAFALWDANQQRLLLVRDRLGVKPLFYAVFEDTLLFGSEVKAILEHPAAQRSLNIEALDFYLSLNYIPAPMTLFKGIYQLEPSQYLIAQAGSTELKITTYWDVDYRQTSALSESQAQAEFAQLLDAAVERRLMADVPLGAFLSGGIDSSAVVACMTRFASEPVKTFSIGFGESSFNEAPFARQVAQHLGTQHFEQTVTPQLATILPKIVWHGEDPLADSSMIPVYYLSEMTRQHVTVALAGDGADEILAGYPTYVATQWAKRLQVLPHQAAQQALAPFLRRLPPSDGKISWREKLARFSAGIGLDWRDAHAVWRQIHTPQQKRAVLAPGLLNGHDRIFETYRRYYQQSRTEDMLHQLLYVDTRLYLPNDMLVKVDRMSMAHGLEARVPFLDYTLVQFVARLPAHMKLRDGVGKYLLRQVMQPQLPAVTLSRKKEGFNIPVAKWLREDLAPMLTDYLTPSRLNEVGIFQPRTIQSMVDDHLGRRADYGHQLWGLLTLMLWWEQFMIRKAQPV